MSRDQAPIIIKVRIAVVVIAIALGAKPSSVRITAAKLASGKLDAWHIYVNLCCETSKRVGIRNIIPCKS